jgi:hypothetical protein
MRLRLLVPVASVALLGGAAACATGGNARVLQTPVPGVRPVTHVASIRDYDVAVVSISAVLQRDFRLPAYPVAFHFFPDRGAFERGLLSLGYSEDFARDTARTMDAIGGYRRVFLNEAALSRQNWPGRVASLAHELTHSLQYELGGARRGLSDQWLREGFAEWMAMQVLHRLRGLNIDEARRRYRAIVRRAGRSRSPALADMVTFPQWVKLNATGVIPAYPYAFLAVDCLIDRHGVDAVINYFSLFAGAQDRAGNFRTAFGEDLQTFEAALLDRVW